ncbi:MAG: hypothetical protein DRR16_26660 [Candidatus Parabeggiatoa sp. nov. 3]|nr:MAG: hypothetical protein DRR00_25455 [Gammaproteobacteria bacterium]RKZ78964.1 MAG: hypothetical protein DRR16_26660 [Gammaproteobacteria bacterium]
MSYSFIPVISCTNWKAKPQQKYENSIAQEIISALKQSNELTIDDAYALLKTIKKSEKTSG